MSRTSQPGLYISVKEAVELLAAKGLPHKGAAIRERLRKGMLKGRKAFGVWQVDSHHLLETSMERLNYPWFCCTGCGAVFAISYPETVRKRDEAKRDAKRHNDSCSGTVEYRAGGC